MSSLTVRLNALPAGEGSATGADLENRVGLPHGSQCPSCGRRVCNLPSLCFLCFEFCVSMPFLRAKGLQHGPRRASLRQAMFGLNALPAGEGSATSSISPLGADTMCLNALPAGEGSATGLGHTDRTLSAGSQCPSCGRRVCNRRRLRHRLRLAQVSMPFLRAKGLQRGRRQAHR